MSKVLVRERAQASRGGTRGGTIPTGGATVRPRIEVTSSMGIAGTLRLGAMIGRGPNADLQLPDPRVSVAHAGLALREGRLCLLRYRGPLWVGGTQAGDPLPLHEGLVVELASDVWIRIVELHLPDEVPVLQVADHRPQLLGEDVWHIDENGVLRWGARSSRPIVWDAHDTWYVREPGGEAIELPHGEAIVVADHAVLFRMQPRREASESGTRQEEVPPLTIRSRFEETEIRVQDRPVVHLHGILHRIVRELGRLTVTEEVRTVHWRDLTERVWPRHPDPQKLWERRKLELRDRLRDHGLPPSLFRSNQGLLQLELRPEDRFELRDPHLTDYR